MGSVGDAYDNAMCESFFATLECELLARRRFTSQVEARMAVFSYIEGWYNPARRHSGIRYLSRRTRLGPLGQSPGGAAPPTSMLKHAFFEYALPEPVLVDLCWLSGNITAVCKCSPYHFL
jgi:transposase InsO family protein